MLYINSKLLPFPVFDPHMSLFYLLIWFGIWLLPETGNFGAISGMEIHVAGACHQDFPFLCEIDGSRQALDCGMDAR